MFRKITACAAALTLTMVPSIQANAEGQNVSVNINGQDKTLSLNATQGKEDEREILGDAWYYGVVADTFSFNGESETNFAVKSLNHLSGGTGGQTGVTDKGSGSRKAFFIAGSVDSPFMVKGINAEVMTPESEKDQFQSTGNQIAYTYENAEDIDAYIDAMENSVAVESQRLRTLDSFSDYSGLTDSGKITMDITPAGNNTVYINVDNWPGLKNRLQQSGDVTIIKNAGQKVVFNFLSDAEVTLQKMSVVSGGKTEDTTALANHSTATDSTAADLIFNMPAATTVNLHDSTGIFLAPKAGVTSYGVDGGWLVADSFTNNCEWHFINGSLPEEITERKTVITPKREGSVLGARRPRPAATPVTEEKPAETPVATSESENKPVSTPVSTPVSENKPVSTPVSTPESENKPVSTPSSTPETKATPSPETAKPEKEETETKQTEEKPSSSPETGKETVSSPKPVETKKTEEKESIDKPAVKKETESVETKKAQPEEMKAVKVANVPKKSNGNAPVHYAKQVKEASPVSGKPAKAIRSETPDTADHSDMNIYSALLIGAGILMIAAIRRMRKEEE